MMRITTAFLVITIACSTVALAAPHDNCDFNAAVGLCQNRVAAAGRCAYFRCLVDHCPTSTMLEVARTWCGTPVHEPADAASPLVEGGMAALIRDSKFPRGRLSGEEEGDDRQPAIIAAARANAAEQQQQQQSEDEAVMGNEEEQYVKRMLEAHRMRHGVSSNTLPAPAPVCKGLEVFDWSKVKAQQLLHHVAWSAYANRHNNRYSADVAARWHSLTNNLCPRSSDAESAHAPPSTSDASSFVTWIFFTIFGKGPDFLHGAEQNWRGGYSGTMLKQGKSVHVEDVQVGDVCFYNSGERPQQAADNDNNMVSGGASTVKHVAIVVGGGMVMSHGHDPIGLYKIDYAPLHSCRRYI